MSQKQFFSMSQEDLAKLFSDILKAELKRFNVDHQPKHQSEFLTRKQLAALIHRDLSTVHNLTVKGILTKYQIGGSVLYRREEVEQAIIKLK